MDKNTVCFWEGACGVVLQARKRNDGDYFWTYRFTRAYKPEGSDDWKYSQEFSEHHDQAIGTLMSKAIQFRQQNEATAWINTQMEKDKAEAA